MSRVEPDDLSPAVIERALDGDAAAFNQFHRRYDPTVRWAVGIRIYCWPQLVPQLEDIVQEVWLELTRRRCKRLRYHDPERGIPFWRFLALISTRYGWKIAKRELGHPEVELEDVLDDDDGWDFIMRIMHADFLDRLAEHVEKELGKDDRALFEGYYVRGEKLKDVGARLDLNENATYKRKERLQKKLQALGEELLRDSPPKIPPDMVAVLLAAFVATGSGERSFGEPVGSVSTIEAPSLGGGA